MESKARNGSGGTAGTGTAGGNRALVLLGAVGVAGTAGLASRHDITCVGHAFGARHRLHALPSRAGGRRAVAILAVAQGSAAHGPVRDRRACSLRARDRA